MIELTQTLDTWFSARLEGIHTALPAQVEKYDLKTRRASVKPLVKLRMARGASVSIPVVDNVPVVFPGSAQALIHFPLSKGDGVLLVFSEAALGNFLAGSGEEMSAENESRFQLTDAIAIPGLWAEAPLSGEEALTIQYQSTTVRLKGDTVEIEASGGLTFEGDLTVKGKIEAEGEVTANAMSAPVSLSTHIHPTAVGPTSPPTPGT